MYPTPNYKWKCKKCGKELTAHQDENISQGVTVAPKCPDCGNEMEGNPIVHEGPFPENPHKKY